MVWELQQLEQLQDQLLQWYAQNQRPLPWRASRDPYRIWLSEVLLQQTQVATGLPYYLRFLERFPSIQDLAVAPQADVLKAWEGCGYYARARNFQRAAQQVAEHGFPKSYTDWLELPGVGPYTAAAVASIAYNLPHAVVDGNVRRVLGRLLAQKNPSSAELQTWADTLLERSQPGAWNQAVMELGAVVCTPKNPRCSACPVQQNCLAFKTGQPQDFPAAKTRAAVKEIYAVALIIGDSQQVYLEQRPKTGLLAGLMGLPLEPFEPPQEFKGTRENQEFKENQELALERLCVRLNITSSGYLGKIQHRFTHRLLEVHVYLGNDQEGFKLMRSRVVDCALATLDHKVLGLLKGTLEDKVQGSLF